MIELQGTKFSLSVLPVKSTCSGYWAHTQISVRNRYIEYVNDSETISKDELEEWIFSMFRLLAGAYGKEYSLSFERAGLAVDFYPYMKDGEETSREERRKNDCVMLIRLLMHSEEEKQFLGGVYSLLFHRKDIEKFAIELRNEFDEIYAQSIPAIGEYAFVGVSPRGYEGCNYWYLDPHKTVKAGEYVWVCMGRHNLEQIVYVDSVRYCNADTAPYDPLRVKQVLRKATESEINEMR